MISTEQSGNSESIHKNGLITPTNPETVKESKAEDRVKSKLTELAMLFSELAAEYGRSLAYSAIYKIILDVASGVAGDKGLKSSIMPRKKPTAFRFRWEVAATALFLAYQMFVKTAKELDFWLFLKVTVAFILLYYTLSDSKLLQLISQLVAFFVKKWLGFSNNLSN